MVIQKKHGQRNSTSLSFCSLWIKSAVNQSFTFFCCCTTVTTSAKLSYTQWKLSLLNFFFSGVLSREHTNTAIIISRILITSVLLLSSDHLVMQYSWEHCVNDNNYQSSSASALDYYYAWRVVVVKAEQDKKTSEDTMWEYGTFELLKARQGDLSVWRSSSTTTTHLPGVWVGG